MFSELELITRDINLLQERYTYYTVLQLLMLHVCTYLIIELLYQLRLLTCMYVLYYTGSACMRCFIPSLLPALQESPPGGEQQAAVNDLGASHDSTSHCALKLA